MKAKHTPSEQHFRTQIQRKLQEAECAPPPLVWENLENHLESKRKKRFGLFWWTGIAASLLLLSMAGWYFTRQSVENPAENSSMALNPVWIHPKQATKSKKTGTTTKMPKQDPAATKPSNPAPTFTKPATKPEMIQPRLKVQTALTNETGFNTSQLQLTLLPATSFNLIVAESLQIDTNLKANIQLPALQSETQELPPVSTRKVYGIGIGKYKLKISLASKE